MKIGIDAAGTELGYQTVIEGVLEAKEKAQGSGRSLDPVFFGSRDIIISNLEQFGADPGQFEIINATDDVTMQDLPSDALLTKKSSSIYQGVQYLAMGKIASFVSMGNTGVIVGACRRFLGRIRWISKPAMAVPLPLENGTGLLLDAGATPDPKPNHLVQFAAMGSGFSESVYRIASPKVGLLNIGSESHKGNELARDTYKLLSRSSLNFIGNLEGGDVLSGKADVVLTSGFVGNIILKLIESIPSIIVKMMPDESVLQSLTSGMSRLDYRRWGGATLLGVNGTVVIGHGRSQSPAVTQAVLWAHKMVSSRIVTVLRDRVFRTRRSLWLSNPFTRGENSEFDTIS